ncbi:MAG: hypothetical protein AAGA77_14695 [Bacteroidota bacterium]
MKKLNYFTLLLLASFTSCVIADDSCDQDITGIYVGSQSCSFASSKTITVTITGTDEAYTLSFEPNSALIEEELEQDGCGFSYNTGSLGNKKSGELTIVGDTLRYSTSGDSFGGLPCKFTGVRQ